MAYTEDSMIRVGDKILSIRETPPLWLVHWYNNNKGRTFQGHKRKLLEWIESNIDRLRGYLKQIHHCESMIPPSETVTKIPCIKKYYLNKEDANKHIRTINKIHSRHKKPVRAYQCPDCGFWHLTSKK